VDYAQVFPQAPLHDPVYMCMPQDWYINEAGIFTQHDDPT